MAGLFLGDKNIYTTERFRISIFVANQRDLTDGDEAAQ